MKQCTTTHFQMEFLLPMFYFREFMMGFPQGTRNGPRLVNGNYKKLEIVWHDTEQKTMDSITCMMKCHKIDRFITKTIISKDDIRNIIYQFIMGNQVPLDSCIALLTRLILIFHGVIEQGKFTFDENISFSGGKDGAFIIYHAEKRNIFVHPRDYQTFFNALLNPLTSQGFFRTPFDFIERAPSVDRRSPSVPMERVNKCGITKCQELTKVMVHSIMKRNTPMEVNNYFGVLTFLTGMSNENTKDPHKLFDLRSFKGVCELLLK